MDIICAHGFGVQKDDRGLFPDIAAACPGYRFHMVDLNDVDQATGNLLTPPLEEQARRLEIFYKTLPDHPKALLAHSMGCVVACLMPTVRFDHMIFITPPYDVDLERTVRTFQDRPGSTIDMNGTSVLMRRDGTQTLVPAEFWVSKQRHDPKAVYQTVTSRRVDMVVAKQDEVVGAGAFHGMPPCFHIHALDGDHNFNSPHRAGFLSHVNKILALVSSVDVQNT